VNQNPFIAIVFHSASGTIRSAIRAVQDGIAQSQTDVETRLIDVADLSGEAETQSDAWATLERAKMIVFATPTYMGGPSAPFKAVMDATGDRIWMKRLWQDKLAAGITSGVNLGGDKLATLTALNVFAMQHGMLWIGQSEIGAPVFPDRPGINDTGTFLGLTVTSGENGNLRPGDNQSARMFGTRLARATQRWAKGRTA
jgi:NAD(P)H dehydrogenase (quinone)